MVNSASSPAGARRSMRCGGVALMRSKLPCRMSSAGRRWASCLLAPPGAHAGSCGATREAVARTLPGPHWGHCAPGAGVGRSGNVGTCVCSSRSSGFRLQGAASAASRTIRESISDATAPVRGPGVAGGRARGERGVSR